MLHFLEFFKTSLFGIIQYHLFETFLKSNSMLEIKEVGLKNLFLRFRAVRRKYTY